MFRNAIATTRTALNLPPSWRSLSRFPKVGLCSQLDGGKSISQLSSFQRRFMGSEIKEKPEVELKPRLSRNSTLQRKAKLKRYRELTRPTKIPSIENSGDMFRRTATGTRRLMGKGAKLAASGLVKFAKAPIVTTKYSYHYIKDGVGDWLKEMWTGTKLFGVQMKTAVKLVEKKFTGKSLTRRENHLLVRSVADIIRAVPFSLFMLVPALEFLLPVFLKVFPNMLPSAFSDKQKEEQKYKNSLKARLEIAEFLQDMTLHISKDAIAKTARQKKKGLSPSANLGAEQLLTVEQLQEFIKHCKSDDQIPEAALANITRLYSDEVLLDNMTGEQLILMCRYMKLNVFAGEKYMRYQLRTKVNRIRKDDRDIYYEGVEDLSMLELRQACEERTMPAYGVSKEKLREQISRWLDQSLNKNVSITLLIMSRAFNQFGVGENMDRAVQRAIGEIDEGVSSMALAEGLEGLIKDKKITSKGGEVQAKKLVAVELQKQLIDAEASEETSKTVDDSKEEKPIEVTTEKVPDIQPVEVEEHEIQDIELKAVVKSLKDLSDQSPVTEEQTKFEKVLAKQKEIDHVEMKDTAKGADEIQPSEEESEEPKAEDKSDKLANKLKKDIAGLLSTIEKDIGEAELKHGENHKILDLDGDGIVSTQELTDVLKSAEKYSDKKIQKIVEKLDGDSDGVVTLARIKQVIDLIEESEPKE